jgi:hypothetical protein
MRRHILSILSLLIITSFAFGQPRVNISLGSDFDDDPYCDESFILGYESAGGTWTGELTFLENQSNEHVLDSLHPDNYDVLTINYTPLDNILRYTPNSSRGLQYILPSGSNNYLDRTGTNVHSVPIICGSGFFSNVTGYGCEFWDRDPFGYNDTIINIIQGGTVFNITGITRVSSTQIMLTIAGNVDNAAGFEHGIPIRISGLSGTDISPLPSGLYYLSDAGSNNLYFNFSTTSGTLSTVQNPSAGTFKYGTNDNYTFIRTTNWNLFFINFGYTIYGVTGFENNPNGDFGIANWVNEDSYGDKFEIVHNLGAGTYTGGGHTTFNSQSYSTPYIAGKISFIKDSVSNRYSRECSWWEARYRARMTASGGGVFDTISGYGRIDVMAAINYRGNIPDDPFTTLGNIGNISAERRGNYINVEFEPVENALYYDVYLNQKLMNTFSVESGIYSKSYSLAYRNRRYPNSVYYIARRGDQLSKESEKAVIQLPYFRRIKIKN